MSTDDNNSTNTDIHSSIPTDLQGEVLEWDGNDAKIMGLLYEVGRFLKRRATLQSYFVTEPC